MQREDQLTMETKLEQIAVKAVNQLPKSVVRNVASAFMWRIAPLVASSAANRPLNAT